MTFHVGDTVVHWTYGMGKIVGVEERSLSDKKTFFYMVKARDLTVYVPIDDSTDTRLRLPTSARQFKKLFAILQEPGKTLTDNRLERKSALRKELATGNVVTICQVIRDLSALAQNKPLNDDDKNILNRAEGLLCAEWGFSLSITLEQAQSELRRLLMRPAANPVG